MRYEEPVYRPPSEAASYLLHVTYGCSHNRCSYCAMYLQKTFRVRPLEQVRQDIEAAACAYPVTDKVFLLDGDAMTLSSARLLPVLESLRAAFPRLRRVSAYSNADSVLDKSDAELRELQEAGLGLLYFGLESGDDPTLERVVKGATAREYTDAVLRSKAAGIKASVMGLIGIAGRERWRTHAEATARVVSEMSPRFFSLLTVTPVPGTSFHEEVQSGRITLPDARETLEELRAILQGLECSGTIFRSNHASNYLPLAGRLPQDRERLVALVDDALDGRLELKPEWLRGL
ncbi:MAG: radical SAM protein [Planctomycetota bacterium]